MASCPHERSAQSRMPPSHPPRRLAGGRWSQGTGAGKRKLGRHRLALDRIRPRVFRAACAQFLCVSAIVGRARRRRCGCLRRRNEEHPRQAFFAGRRTLSGRNLEFRPRRLDGLRPAGDRYRCAGRRRRQAPALRQRQLDKKQPGRLGAGYVHTRSLRRIPVDSPA